MFLLIAYILAGVALWFLAHRIGPIGYEISFLRACLVAVVMWVGATLSSIYLTPVIGSWRFLVNLGVGIIVAKVFLQLAFWRCVLIVVAFTIVIVVITFGIGLLLSDHPRP